MAYQLKKQDQKQFIVKMYSTRSGEEQYKFHRSAEEMVSMNWGYYLSSGTELECQVFSNPSWGLPAECYELTDADEMAIKFMLAIVPTISGQGFVYSQNNPCNKVAAIKYFRTRFEGTSLKEAKDAVEAYATELFSRE